MQCIGIDPITDPAWHTMLQHPAAGLFHSPPWLRAVADAYGFAIRAYLARDTSGALAGAMAFCELNDFAGHRIVSLPFSDTCDPLCLSCDAWRALFARLQAHQVPVHLRCLGEPRLSAASPLSITKRARWHRLALEASPEALWQRMTPAARRAIRHAQRAGVEVRPMVGDRDRETFYGLHVALRKQKYHLLAQPPDFFAAIERHFRDVDGWYALSAYLGERMIAATIYLRWRDGLYYKFNASALDCLPMRPNNLLMWAGITLAQSLGCRFLDLGPSDDDQPGLIRFKRGFGAEEYELCFLHWVPPDWRAPQLDTRRVLREMTRALTAPEVSDAVTAWAGTTFYRFFA